LTPNIDNSARPPAVAGSADCVLCTFAVGNNGADSPNVEDSSHSVTMYIETASSLTGPDRISRW
jgi:hypothetical protein